MGLGWIGVNAVKIDREFLYSASAAHGERSRAHVAEPLRAIGQVGGRGDCDGLRAHGSGLLKVRGHASDRGRVGVGHSLLPLCAERRLRRRLHGDGGRRVCRKRSGTCQLRLTVSGLPPSGAGRRCLGECSRLVGGGHCRGGCCVRLMSHVLHLRHLLSGLNGRQGLHLRHGLHRLRRLGRDLHLPLHLPLHLALLWLGVHGPCAVGWLALAEVVHLLDGRCPHGGSRLPWDGPIRHNDHLDRCAGASELRRRTCNHRESRRLSRAHRGGGGDGPTSRAAQLVVAVLDGVRTPAGHVGCDLCPAPAEGSYTIEDNAIVRRGEGRLLHIGFEVVVPAFTALPVLACADEGRDAVPVVRTVSLDGLEEGRVLFRRPAAARPARKDLCVWWGLRHGGGFRRWRKSAQMPKGGGKKVRLKATHGSPALS
mmetsp:Transcript_5826/g.17334  ORF Transcript_5826/g.17334 Transcript_5826/m.17334 type:complete len:425 (+) Transcript_5826:346-1620(+)